MPEAEVTLTHFGGGSECGHSVRLLLKSDRADVS